jgi:integral membrane sensor domain MASE1
VAALSIVGFAAWESYTEIWATWWLGNATSAIMVALGPLLPPSSGRNALAFLAALPLLWATLRGGRGNTATVALILSAFTIWGVAELSDAFQSALLTPEKGRP